MATYSSALLFNNTYASMNTLPSSVEIVPTARLVSRCLFLVRSVYAALPLTCPCIELTHAKPATTSRKSFFIMVTSPEVFDQSLDAAPHSVLLVALERVEITSLQKKERWGRQLEYRPQ